MVDISSTSIHNSTPSEFDSDAAMTPLADDRFAVNVPSRWSTGPGANGGFVAGLLTRAVLSKARPGHDLRTLTVNYLRPRGAGPGRDRT